MMGSIKVLIVDDIPTNVALMQATLEALSVTDHADVAEDGATAVELLSRTAYDLVLLDFHLPDIDGAAVMGWMNDKLIHRPNIVVISADNRTSTVRRVEALGCDAFLCKPVMLDDLRAVLSPLVAASRRPHVVYAACN